MSGDYYVIIKNPDEFDDILSCFSNNDFFLRRSVESYNNNKSIFFYFRHATNLDFFVCFFYDDSRKKTRLYVYLIYLTKGRDFNIGEIDGIKKVRTEELNITKKARTEEFNGTTSSLLYHDVIIGAICNKYKYKSNTLGFKYAHVYSIELLNYPGGDKRPGPLSLSDCFSYFKPFSNYLSSLSDVKGVLNPNASHIPNPFGNNKHKPSHILSKNCEKCGNIII